MTTLLAACALAWAVQAEASAPSVPVADTEAIPTDAAQLRDLIADLDRRMFEAYNAHDVDGLMAMFAEDLEFYHDTGGLLDFQQVKAGFTNVFANNKDVRRDLVPGSLEVYPIHGYGAIRQGGLRYVPVHAGLAVQRRRLESLA